MNKLRQLQALGAIDAILTQLDPEDALAVVDFLAGKESTAELSERLDELETAITADEEPTGRTTKYLGEG